MTSIFVVSAVRSAIGGFGGALRGTAPSALAAQLIAAAVARAGLPPDAVGQVVLGHVIPTEPTDLYLSRHAAVRAGLPVGTVAMNVNRICGSGLQAILSAAQAIRLGDVDIAVAGGVEIMSRAPHLATDARFGRRLGNQTLLDLLVGALTDPFDDVHMGITAENVARSHGITRAMQDDLAFESHRRASAAIRAGYFDDQIVPIEIRAGGRTTLFDRDEHVRHDAARADFDGLRPAFLKDGGTVTAGNASGINDGAGMVMLASEDAVRRLGLTPLARLVAYGHAGVEPSQMGMGPVPATRTALGRAGLGTADLDILEINEAFAAQACAVTRALDLDPVRVNPNGSGISLGHPIGASGAIATVRLLHELARTGARTGLVSLCIGGGQGIAAVFERA
ncbi:beta-ketothiolase BktB [Gluconacetobacter azotocaptans]|uniref:Beta-ketothiolase BktB n=1 Tax=Gluconacetobacter azotocaptans TaxID=142834 RepID=A0A7W4JQY6_9PROT|nr:beta-ketothiolase BktB [Gluconacetobacter azotocaptans]MBB2189310.1 beta-ketothiolase BktB [Gluconacetobacter azotocaptans]GBQ28686.1 acetyl-CoA acetyltransferase [Gluconacetobacter azotocaptans DSM 13594]